MDEEYGGHYYIGPETWDKGRLMTSAQTAAGHVGKPQLIHQHRHAEKCHGHVHLRVEASGDPIEVEDYGAERLRGNRNQ